MTTWEEMWYNLETLDILGMKKVNLSVFKRCNNAAQYNLLAKKNPLLEPEFQRIKTWLNKYEILCSK